LATLPLATPTKLKISGSGDREKSDLLHRITASPGRRALAHPISGLPDLLIIVNLSYRRGGALGPLFLTLGLREPRGSVRFGLGGRFLRAARFSLLRSALSLIFLVSIICLSLLS